MTDESFPTVNWPEVSGKYKAVQLEIDGQPYIKLGEMEGSHAGIIEDILFDHGIYEYERIISGTEVGSVPAPEGKTYKVHGAGETEIDVEKKHATFFGCSLGYQFGIDKKHLNYIRKLEPDWEIHIF